MNLLHQTARSQHQTMYFTYIVQDIFGGGAHLQKENTLLLYMVAMIVETLGYQVLTDGLLVCKTLL